MTEGLPPSQACGPDYTHELGTLMVYPEGSRQLTSSVVTKI